MPIYRKLPGRQARRAIFGSRACYAQVSRVKEVDMATGASEPTDKLLRVIIALLLRGKSEQTPTLRQQIELLSRLGMKPTEISEILGKTSTHINTELSAIRKSAKKT